MLTAVAACALPVQVWQDEGALFGIVALVFPAMIIAGLFAGEWLLEPRPPGPRYLAPLGPLPVVPMVFVLCGWLLEQSATTSLLIALAVFAPLAVLGLVRHPRQ